MFTYVRLRHLHVPIPFPRSFHAFFTSSRLPRGHRSASPGCLSACRFGTRRSSLFPQVLLLSHFSHYFCVMPSPLLTSGPGETTNPARGTLLDVGYAVQPSLQPSVGLLRSPSPRPLPLQGSPFAAFRKSSGLLFLGLPLPIRFARISRV